MRMATRSLRRAEARRDRNGHRGDGGERSTSHHWRRRLREQTAEPCRADAGSPCLRCSGQPPRLARCSRPTNPVRGINGMRDFQAASMGMLQEAGFKAGTFDQPLGRHEGRRDG